MKSLILAAGYATRLYPLTKEFPKPLLEVGGKPMIDYIVQKLEALEEVEEIIVVTNSKFAGRFREWAKSQKTKKRLSVLDDLTHSKEDRRGAIGDMHFAIENKHIKKDLLVVGGDNIFDGDLRSFLDFAKKHQNKPIIGAFDIKVKAKARQYGVIKVDKKHTIVDFAEKPSRPASTLVAMCLYYFPKQRLGLLDEYLRSKTDKHDATGFYIDWLRRTVSVKAYVFGGRWYDIGHHDFYQEAREKFSEHISFACRGRQGVGNNRNRRHNL